MKLKREASLLGDRSPLLCSVRAQVFIGGNKPTVLHIGVYAGSSWDVPTSQRSHALDRAIQKI